jgi:predicted dinucleotide-binding enzyme
MKIVTLGRGNIGGGLARLWRDAGHDVTELGREGGDASGAEVVLLAVPWAQIADALGKADGIGGGVPVIDATNLINGEVPDGHASLAAYVKTLTGAPVAKVFNLNFARLYGELGSTRVRPSQVFAADDEARAVTEQLVRDAGYEPVYAGGLENAGALERALGMFFAISQQSGPFFYRLGAPDRL